MLPIARHIFILLSRELDPLYAATMPFNNLVTTGGRAKKRELTRLRAPFGKVDSMFRCFIGLFRNLLRSHRHPEFNHGAYLRRDVGINQFDVRDEFLARRNQNRGG